MLRKGNKFPFEADPELLKEMLALKKKGKTVAFLAAKYSVDHTSIIYRCEKENIRTDRVRPKRKIFNLSYRGPKLPKVYGVLGINRGLESYAKYTEVEKEREFRMLKCIK